MNKKFLMMALAAAMVTGCASNGGGAVSYEALQAQGLELYTQSVSDNYKPSTVEQIEVARTIVNTAFIVSKPAYEQYTDGLLKDSEVKTYFAAVEAAETEAAKRAVYDRLSEETRQSVDTFVNGEEGSKIMSGLAEASEVALKNIAIFKAIDASDMMKAVSFADLMAEKEKLALTIDQVEYLNDTVISAYSNYRVVAAFSDAQ